MVANLAKTLIVTGAAVGGAVAMFLGRKRRAHEVGAASVSDPPPRPNAEPPPSGRHVVRRSEGPARSEFHGTPPLYDPVGHHGTPELELLGLSRDDQVTARPHAHTPRPSSGDDIDAFSADELGMAFLTRATESSSDDLDEGLEGLTEVTNPEGSLMSEASLLAALPDENGAGGDPFADDSWMDYDAERERDSGKVSRR